MPEQVIMVNEDRNFVERAKGFMKQQNEKIKNFKNNYEENYIKTGKSAQLEEKIEAYAKKKKRVIKIAGTIATVALTICPADGPFGEICTALATPGLCALVDIATNIQKKMLIAGKREAEKLFLNVDGSSGNVEAYNLENGKVVSDLKDLMENLDNFSKARSL